MIKLINGVKVLVRIGKDGKVDKTEVHDALCAIADIIEGASEMAKPFVNGTVTTIAEAVAEFMRKAADWSVED